MTDRPDAGYNSKGWVGYGEDRPGKSNFLYAWQSSESFVKLPKVGGAGMGVVDNGAVTKLHGAFKMHCAQRGIRGRSAQWLVTA